MKLRDLLIAAALVVAGTLLACHGHIAAAPTKACVGCLPLWVEDKDGGTDP